MFSAQRYEKSPAFPQGFFWCAIPIQKPTKDFFVADGGDGIPLCFLLLRAFLIRAESFWNIFKWYAEILFAPHGKTRYTGTKIHPRRGTREDSACGR